MSEPTTQIVYAALKPRLSALLIDLVLFLVLMFGGGLALSAIELSGPVKLAIFAVLLFSFEPGLVAWTGGTVGHHLMGLRVQKSLSGDRLGVLQAIIRFVVKTIIGILSMIFILTTRRYQALHDLASKSVVVDIRPENRPYPVEMGDQIIESDKYLYPSKRRRVILILANLFCAHITINLTTYFLLTPSCFNDGQCNWVEQLIAAVSGILYLAAFGAIIVFGWRGRLWGARRTLRSELRSAETVSQL